MSLANLSLAALAATVGSWCRSDLFARDIRSPYGRRCHERIFRPRHPLAMARDVTSESFARDIRSPYGLRCHERILRSRHLLSISMSGLEVSRLTFSLGASMSRLEISPWKFRPDFFARHFDVPTGNFAPDFFARYFDFSVRYARSEFFAPDIHSPSGWICHERTFRSRHPLAI